MGAAGAIALSSVAALAWPKAKSRVIKVVAKKFEFVPGEIHVKQGETRRGRSRSSAMSSAAPAMKT